MPKAACTVKKREVARESLVLLKNRLETLPLKNLQPLRWLARWQTASVT